MLYRATSLLASRTRSCVYSCFLSKRRTLAALPNHTVLGMPALSPTMEMGNIAKWMKKRGDSFTVGDVFCQVETDKATVDFDAQDEGFIAKLLVDEGAQGVKVGSPILIVVDDEESVSKFDSYDLPTSGPSVEEQKEKPATSIEPSKSSSAAEPKLIEKVQVPSMPTATAPPKVVLPLSEPVKTAPTEERKPPISVGQSIKKSALYSRLAKDSEMYVSKYGSTLQDL